MDEPIAEGLGRITQITEKLNEGIDYFLSGDADLILIVDSDIEAPTYGLINLLNLDVDIASGVYINKTQPNYVVSGYFEEGALELEQIHGEIIGQDKRVWSGNGFLLIKRRVLKFLRFRYEGPNATGSDIQFFHDAQDLGFSCRLHTGILCGHLPSFPLP